MSGAFDPTVIISGRTAGGCLACRRAPGPSGGVTGTATHFILKKYKEKHLVFRPEPLEREFVFHELRSDHF